MWTFQASSKTNKNAFSVSLDNSQSMLYKVGDFVDVASRMKPGENKPGGRAKVIRVNHSNGTVDVKYIMESKREKDIHPKFLSLHEEGRRTSRFAKLKAKESLAKASIHMKTKDGGNVQNHRICVNIGFVVWKKCNQQQCNRDVSTCHQIDTGRLECQRKT